VVIGVAASPAGRDGVAWLFGWAAADRASANPKVTRSSLYVLFGSRTLSEFILFSLRTSVFL
jgi:hypothetical protein